MSDQKFPHCFDFTPSEVVIIPTYPGQSKVLANGDVRAWFTEAQYRDVKYLVAAILGTNNNRMEANNEVVSRIPLPTH